ncbi:UPF0223 family protein [Vagococcus xieshaowenii]|uniref:UPF0223 family protein n=1 Tax=Vagococcus xieshaowenii TaxID=2562451 RepID=A0AAJ5JLH0_9ENTE|nr:UPF0223 family protein [Vagococcus xieshaowenii]QCA28085.1 UPF0223 family protein [Vagococcus xieshaowenii]TFZ40128.1 UPF0223 family protein [Vagococcus xieshaowenii]
MAENYSYPMDMDWTHDEITKVIEMWALIEEVYEKGVEKERLMSVYEQFKSVVKSIGEERSLGKEYEELSGYSLYRVMQKARATDKGKVKM